IIDNLKNALFKKLIIGTSVTKLLTQLIADDVKLMTNDGCTGTVILLLQPSPLLETHLKDVEESFRFTESGIDNLEALHNEKVEMKSSMQKRITKI
ncbi:Uncharacterized protein APZ42_033357, partial [Daphnia magna]